ncbi:hypothetical protein AAFF_G00138250 [Aldrovandia affinis]|uniref:Uncharacterized protein n=1 Tax=Aldrovandia affinis TaxID=143900 RepID=A0AAD7TDE2_9TELE|nr:hypothetical protein AAFF_G00138250 [Aldrovandia affinis]
MGKGTAQNTVDTTILITMVTLIPTTVCSGGVGAVHVPVPRDCAYLAVSIQKLTQEQCMSFTHPSLASASASAFRKQPVSRCANEAAVNCAVPGAPLPVLSPGGGGTSCHGCTEQRAATEVLDETAPASLWTELGLNVSIARNRSLRLPGTP